MFGKEKYDISAGAGGAMQFTLQSLDSSTYAVDVLKDKSIYSLDKYYESYVKREVRNGHEKKRYIYYVEKSNSSLISLHRSISKYLAPPCSENVFSYRNSMSSKDVAQRHIESKYIYKLDIKDYFPSITAEMIEEMYLEWFSRIKTKSLIPDPGKSAKLVSLICTRSDMRPADEGGNNTSRILPIGISPSSAISNSILYDFDMWVVNNLPDGCVYSRYSDNLFISSRRKKGVPESFRNDVISVLESVSIAGRIPFRVNEKKTQYVPHWRSQRVLGTVVNVKVNVPRSKAMKTRSALNHLYYEVQAMHDDLESGKLKRKDYAWKRFNKLNSRCRIVFGNLAYFQAINPEKYNRYSSHHHSIKIALETCRSIIKRRELS